MGDLDDYLRAGPTRAALSVLGLVAAGFLFALALAFGMCMPADCAWSRTIAWVFVAGATACLASVILLAMPNSSARVRTTAASIVGIGLVFSTGLWFFVV